MAAIDRRAAAQRLALRAGPFAATSLIALGLALMDAIPARAQTVWNGANPADWLSAGIGVPAFLSPEPRHRSTPGSR